MAMISLKCNECGGILDVDDQKKVLFCPYCGSKELLVESDAVKIEQIRSNTYQAVETARYSTAERMNARQIEFEEKRQKEKDNRKSAIIGVAIAIIALLAFKFIVGF